jgi:membrane associated rhomboid family serine protease
MQKPSAVVLNLIIINTLVFLAQMVISGGVEPDTVTDLFALHHYKSDYFKPHQLVTYLFMHGGFFHLLFNMFSLWMFGSSVENALGSKKFLIFYFICGIGAGLTQLASYAHQFWEIDHNLLSADIADQYQMVLRRVATVGASGSIMGVLVAFGYMFANTELFIIPIPFPIKAKWAVSGMIAYDIFGGVAKVQGDNVAHFAHIGGALIGFLLILYWNKSNRKTFY